MISRITMVTGVSVVTVVQLLAGAVTKSVDWLRVGGDPIQ